MLGLRMFLRVRGISKSFAFAEELTSWKSSLSLPMENLTSWKSSASLVAWWDLL